MCILKQYRGRKKLCAKGGIGAVKKFRMDAQAYYLALLINPLQAKRGMRLKKQDLSGLAKELFFIGMDRKRAGQHRKKCKILVKYLFLGSQV